MVRKGRVITPSSPDEGEDATSTPPALVMVLLPWLLLRLGLGECEGPLVEGGVRRSGRAGRQAGRKASQQTVSVGAVSKRRVRRSLMQQQQLACCPTSSAQPAWREAGQAHMGRGGGRPAAPVHGGPPTEHAGLRGEPHEQRAHHPEEEKGAAGGSTTTAHTSSHTTAEASQDDGGPSID